MRTEPVHRDVRARDEMGTRAVSGLVGCSYSKLNRWLAVGLIGGEPVHPGSGMHLILDEFDLEQAWVLARLAELGVTMPVMARALEDLRRHGRPKDGDCLIVMPPEGAALVWNRSAPFGPDPAWVVPLQTAEYILDPDDVWVTVERERPPA